MIYKDKIITFNNDINSTNKTALYGTKDIEHRKLYSTFKFLVLVQKPISFRYPVMNSNYKM